MKSSFKASSPADDWAVMIASRQWGWPGCMFGFGLGDRGVAGFGGGFVQG